MSARVPRVHHRLLPPLGARGNSLVGTAVLIGLGLAVLLPFGLVIINSFKTFLPDGSTIYSVAPWEEALNNPRIIGALFNTLTLTIAIEVTSMAIGIPLAWLVGRSDLPFRGIIEFLFWIAIFLPALSVTQGWILLLDPHYGLLNQALMQLPWVHEAPFNIYSFNGLVWVHLAKASIAIKVVLLSPILRNIDSTLEEAAVVSGASRLRTLVQIVVPVILPAIAIVVLLSGLNYLQSFEAEQVIGPPFRFYVFSTLVYAFLGQEPPAFEQATVLATIIVMVIIPLILLQRWISQRRDYRTVTGQIRRSRVRLGKWRWPAFLFAMFIALCSTIIPMSMVVMSSFMKLFGFFDLPDPWTLMHWTSVIGQPRFTSAFVNTLQLAGLVTIVAVLAFPLIAYLAARTRYRGRSAIDFLAWLPSTLPGIILGLGFLWLILGSPFLRPAYDTLFTLVPAVTIAHMTIGIAVLKAVLLQFGPELEEASLISGGSRLQAIKDVVLPLLAPALFLVASFAFLAASRDVATVALLSNTNAQPLALLQLNYLIQDNRAGAAVIGVVVAAITLTIAVVSRVVGSRFGLRDREGII